MGQTQRLVPLASLGWMVVQHHQTCIYTINNFWCFIRVSPPKNHKLLPWLAAIWCCGYHPQNPWIDLYFARPEPAKGMGKNKEIRGSEEKGANFQCWRMGLCLATTIPTTNSSLTKEHEALALILRTLWDTRASWNSSKQVEAFQVGPNTSCLPCIPPEEEVRKDQLIYATTATDKRGKSSFLSNTTI